MKGVWESGKKTPDEMGGQEAGLERNKRAVSDKLKEWLIEGG